MWRCPNCGEKVDAGFEICWSCGSTPDGDVDPAFDAETEGIVTPTEFQRMEEERAREQLVTVATFLGPGEAHLARSRLEAEGIHAYLADEYMVTMDWLVSNAVGGVKLQVAESNVDHARRILATKAGPDERERLPDEYEDEDEEDEDSDSR